MVWEKNWDWELASCFLTISARSLWLKYIFQSPTNCSTVMFMYFYRDLRSNFYRRMLEFTYCLKVESKSTETVANCDETSGSADGFKSVWTDQLFAKDLHVYLFKRYYDLQLHSVLYMSKEVAHYHWKSLNFCEFGVCAIFLETVESKITGFQIFVSFDAILDILVWKT